jgi:hypothetical protein
MKLDTELARLAEEKESFWNDVFPKQPKKIMTVTRRFGFCLVHLENQKHFKIFRHIKSFCTCIEH